MLPDFSEACIILLKGLLEKNVYIIFLYLIKFYFKLKPKKRLGYNGADEIKKSEFFKHINWEDMALKKVDTPFRPRCSSILDL